MNKLEGDEREPRAPGVKGQLLFLSKSKPEMDENESEWRIFSTRIISLKINSTPPSEVAQSLEKQQKI